MSELNSQARLAFTPRQELQRPAERGSYVLELFHRRRIGSIQQIEELEDDPYAHLLSDRERL